MLSLLIYAYTSDASKKHSINLQKKDRLEKRTTVIDISGVILNGKRKSTDSNFLSFWKRFSHIVKTKNYKDFRKYALDSLECEHRIIPASLFVRSYFSKVFDDSLLLRFSDMQRVTFMDFQVDQNYFSRYINKQLKKGNSIIKQVSVVKYNDFSKGPLTIVLEFIDTKVGYKFYGFDKFG